MFVLDASALLCLLQAEPGADRVAEALPQAAISTVNVSEVVAKLRERGLSQAEVEEALGILHLDIRPFSAVNALAAGHLRPATRAAGLSLGDRACLALAAELGATALTTDRAWSGLAVDVGVEVIR